MPATSCIKQLKDPILNMQPIYELYGGTPLPGATAVDHFVVQKQPLHAVPLHQTLTQDEHIFYVCHNADVHHNVSSTCHLLRSIPWHSIIRLCVIMCALPSAPNDHTGRVNAVCVFATLEPAACCLAPSECIQQATHVHPPPIPSFLLAPCESGQGCRWAAPWWCP
jgi:hypothetical protein